MHEMLHFTVEGLGGMPRAPRLAISCQSHCTLELPLRNSPGPFNCQGPNNPLIWTEIYKHVHTYFFISYSYNNPVR